LKRDILLYANIGSMDSGVKGIGRPQIADCGFRIAE
jgi:hypothetical protein